MLDKKKVITLKLFLSLGTSPNFFYTKTKIKKFLSYLLSQKNNYDRNPLEGSSEPQLKIYKFYNALVIFILRAQEKSLDRLQRQCVTACSFFRLKTKHFAWIRMSLYKRKSGFSRYC